jgi:large subunit ribosomal protein L4
MSSLNMKTADGGAGADVDLPDDVFGIEPNVAVMHQVVTAQLAAKRAGTHSTKTRAEVQGGGAKPWRQKGTGRARQGSIRAPQWRGGGVAHGPHPRDYSQRTPKKMIAAALLGALSDRARGERLQIVDSFGIEGAPSTKAAAAFFAKAGATKRVLVVIERSDEVTIKSVRNLAYVHVLTFDQLNAYDVLVSDDIVFTKAAYDAFVASKAGATEEVSA